MSSESWGMLAFFLTTIFFYATTLIYRQRLIQARRCQPRVIGALLSLLLTHTVISGTLVLI